MRILKKKKKKKNINQIKYIMHIHLVSNEKTISVHGLELMCCRFLSSLFYLGVPVLAYSNVAWSGIIFLVWLAAD